MGNRVLEKPVTQVKGVGKLKIDDLKALGITTVIDLLEYLPFRYEDYRIRDLTQVKDGEKVTIQGTVYHEPTLTYFGRKKSRLIAKVVVDHLVITATWFNQPFLQSQLRPGREVVLIGKWDQRRLQITVNQIEFMDQPKSQAVGSLQPVYSVGGQITQHFLRKAIGQAFTQFSEAIEENLPTELLRKYKLISRKMALYALHYPEDQEAGRQARRRFAYEELFLFQLKLQAYRTLHRRAGSGIQHSFAKDKLSAFINRLPFELTDAQKQVIEEILREMQSPYPMNRLLQGDVGSGKTVVAAIALYACVLSKYQGALMVPTEILAEQHANALVEWFRPLGIEVGLLKGGLTERQRRDVLAQLQMGMIDILVGTHALIQEDVYFKALGLVVTDEQHRFGVEQRGILRRKGLDPDVLFMTATPIPRTLAITAFGDMDVSTIRELPKGRIPIETYWVKHELLERVIQHVQKQLDLGHQAYVICPLIEESDKLDVQNAIDVFHQFSHAIQGHRVGLMHGRLASQEKEAAMREFSENKVQVLVSTTVVEVGVNVPNATVMVVMDADRFGLAQLHQLRGRVGRASYASYCILIADPKGEVGKERMRAMTETRDGFEIAERDLQIRGPGDFFGTKQSGLPEFKVADLANDYRIVECARDDAAALLAKDQFWSDEAYQPLRDVLISDHILEGPNLD